MYPSLTKQMFEAIVRQITLKIYDTLTYDQQITVDLHGMKFEINEMIYAVAFEVFNGNFDSSTVLFFQKYNDRFESFVESLPPEFSPIDYAVGMLNVMIEIMNEQGL